VNAFISHADQDSGKTYITTSSASEELFFDKVIIKGAGHLVFKHLIPVRIGQLSGDLTGMLHSSHSSHITVEDSDNPFPAAFTVYQNTNLTLPSGE